MRAGSKYIDFKGINLSGTTQQNPKIIPGIYEAVESCYPDKELVLCNVNFTGNGGETFDTARTLIGTDFVFALYQQIIGTETKGVRIHRLYVTSEDHVYIKYEQTT